MGMDVNGKNPSSETGIYFNRNVWGWRPIPVYISQVAPNLYNKCPYWHTNDGGGLNAVDSDKLAEIIQQEIDSGRAEAYVKIRDAELAAMPSEECDLCHGTGTRNDEHVKGQCNKCEGKGSVRPYDTWYFLNVQDLQEFANFCRESGGFEIW